MNREMKDSGIPWTGETSKAGQAGVFVRAMTPKCQNPSPETNLLLRLHINYNNLEETIRHLLHYIPLELKQVVED